MTCMKLPVASPSSSPYVTEGYVGPVVQRREPGSVVVDLALIFLAAIVILGGLIAFEQPRQVYPAPASSARVRSYVIGGSALAVGVGILVFVVLRGGAAWWRSLCRLTGVLVAGAAFPLVIGSLSAAYFGAMAAVWAGLAMGVGLVAIGATLLRRS